MTEPNFGKRIGTFEFDYMNRTARQKVGELMVQYHASAGDPYYAVGSYYLTNKGYPKIDVVERALGQVESDLRRASAGSGGWGKQEAQELHAIGKYLAWDIARMKRVSASESGRAGRAGGSSSSRNRLGDRRACGRCGMDIEFQGSRFGWMGRGKDRFCDDSGSGIPNMPHKLHDPNAKPIARRAGRAGGASGGAMTRAELTKLIRSAINPGVARRNIVKVSDTHVDGPLAGHGGSVFVVFSSVPPGSSEIDALNARVSFMLAIEAPEWSQVKTAHHGPNLPAKRVTLRQFKGRTSIRGRSGTPESIARYVADIVNTADVVRRPGRAGGSSDGVRVVDKDRKKLLMAIYKSTNVSDKMLRGGKHTIMLVGGSAERFGVSNYTNVVLEDLDNAELYRLAKARGVIKPGRAGGRAGGMLGKGASADGVSIGDTLVYTKPHPAYRGREFRGRVVMRGPAGWVVNKGGRHGTPDVVDDERIVRVIPARLKNGRAAGLTAGYTRTGYAAEVKRQLAARLGKGPRGLSKRILDTIRPMIREGYDVNESPAVLATRIGRAYGW